MAMNFMISNSKKFSLLGWRCIFVRMKVDLAIEIASRETIKPTYPTPKHLRTHKLCLLDQLVLPVYSPILYFYKNNNNNNNNLDTNFAKLSNELKKSLAETLNKFYPLAGRVKDNLSVNCNDKGVDYIEAHVQEDMSTLLKQPDMQLLHQLLPRYQFACGPLGEHVMLAVQINKFHCGGIAIGVCLHHRVGDGPTLATFVKTWAANSRGDALLDTFVFDSTSIFPPLKDFSADALDVDVASTLANKVTNSVTKRFVFDKSKICALKEKSTIDSHSKRPTRVRAVSAFLWATATTIAKQKNPNLKMTLLGIPVDLRKRIKSWLPPHSLGNIFYMGVAQATMTESVSYDILVKRVHDSIVMLTDEYIRKTFSQDGVGEYIKSWKNTSEKWAANSGEIYMFLTTSLCKYPLYEADFGWGSPIWAACGYSAPNCAVLMDAKDGKGVEAWVSLLEEDMENFERHSDILDYVSFIY